MRKIALISLLGLAIWPAGVLALGLGEIQLKSALNQPLEAEVGLLSVRAGETDGMIVSLAPQAAFLRAGIDRPFMLTQLRFEVKLRPDGAPYIEITTRRPIVEPFLNFLVEVDWPRGRLLKEYTILLDPPVFMTDMATAGTPQAPVAGGDEQAAGAAVPGAIVRSDTAPLPDLLPEPTLAAEPSSLEAEPASPEPSPPSLAAAPEPMAPVQPEPVPEPMAQIEPDPTLDPLDPEPTEIEPLEPEPTLAAPPPMTASDELFPRIDVSQSYDVSQLPGGFAAATAPAPAAPAAPAYEGDTYGPVQGNETLWGIANRTRPQGASVNQMMLALLQYNPEAFFEDNINNLRQGVVLRLPDQATVFALDDGDANAEVTAQNALWQEMRQRAAGAAPVMTGQAEPEPEPATTGVPAVSADTTDASRLALVADDQGAESASSVSTTSAGDGAGDELLQRELTLAREELSAERLENQELRDKVSELESIVANVESLITLRENEVADLQARLRSLEQQAAVQPPVVAEPEPAMQVEPEPVPEPLPEPVVAEPEPAAPEPSPVVEPEPAPPEAAVQVEPPPPPPPAPAVLPSVPPRRGFVDQLMADLMAGRILDNPVLLAIIGGFVILLLAVWLLVRRRGGDEEAIEVDVEAMPDHDDLLEDPGMTVEAVIDETLDEDDRDDAVVALDDETMAEAPEPDRTISMDDAVADAEDDAPKDDTIAEADVYLAYGLYSQSEDLLKQALAEHPDRHEYHEKLLETYFAANNKEAFESQADSFHKLLAGTPSRLWDRVVAMGGELCPENPLFSGAAELDISAQELQPAKPETPDLELGGEALTPDLDFGIDEDETYVNTGTDFDTGEIPLVDDETIHEEDALDTTQLMEEAPGMGLDMDKGDTADHMELDTAEVERISGERETVALDGEMEFDITASDLDELGTPTDAFPSAPDMEGLDSDDDDDIPELTSGEHPAVATPTGEYDMSKLEQALSEETDIMEGEPAFDRTSEPEFEDEPGPNYNMGGTAEIPVMDDVDDFELDLDAEDEKTGDGEPSVVSQLVTSVSEDLLDDDDEADDDDEPRLVSEVMPSITDDMIDRTVVQDAISFRGDAPEADDGDEVETMLDLAKAYLDMGDSDSATSALEEIMAAGNDRQRQEAQELLQKIS